MGIRHKRRIHNTHLKSILYAILILPVIALLIVVNVRFAMANARREMTAPIAGIPQLMHVKEKIHSGTAESMQRIFPEGFLFMNVLYGLSCAEIAAQAALPESSRLEWLKEGRWALKNIESPKGTEAFVPNFSSKSAMCPQYGIFYDGWANYLRAKLCQAKPIGGVIDSSNFEGACDRIAECFRSSESPFLESYPSAIWPADNVTAIASLALHDRLFTPRFSDLISSWLRKVDVRLDSHTLLIPHSALASTGQTHEGARGCSQALMIRFLYEIDSTFAHAHYDRFRRQFTASFLGMPGIREYPKGHTGHGDIDSGPVLFGIGAAATIVGVGTARVAGDMALANGLSGFVETIGFPISIKGRKNYGFGLMPIGDAFLCWSEVSGIGKSGEQWPRYTGFSLHTISVILIALMLLPIWFILGRKGRA